MPNPPDRQIFLPNYKLNITVPSDYSDDQVANAIQRNRAQIQQRSPVYAQGQQYIQNGLGPNDAGNGLQAPGLGITEQQARAQGIGPAIQAAQAALQYNQSDQAALLRHDAAVRAINSADQRPNAAQIVAQAQPNLLPPDRLTAIGDRATGALNDAVNLPLLDHVLDYGAPGASQQLGHMQGYGAGLAQGIMGFSSPGALGAMALLGPVGAEPMGANVLLGAFGAPAVAHAYQRSQTGDIGGALGELTAFSLPVALHLGGLAQEAKNAADYRAGARWMDENYGVDVDPPVQPLLPPGPDPNVYSAEFHPDQPTALSSIELAASLGQSGSNPQIARYLAMDRFIDDPAGKVVPEPLGSAVPMSYGERVANPSSSVVVDRYSPLSYDRTGLDTQDGTMVVYRPASRMPQSDVLPISVGSDLDAASLASSYPSPTVIAPPDLPRVPLSITSGEAQMLSVLLGEQHPFSNITDRLFADGRTTANLPVTSPDLTALRRLVGQTTIPLGDQPGSYSRASFLKRLGATIRNFPDASETGVVPHQTSEIAPVIPQSPSSVSELPIGPSAKYPVNLKPLAQKLSEPDTNQGQAYDRLPLAQANNGTEFLNTSGKDPSRFMPAKIGKSSEFNNEDRSTALRLAPVGNLDEVTGDVQRYVTPTQREGTGDRWNRRFSMGDESNDESIKMLPEPRLKVEGTLVEGHLSSEWYREYARYVLKERVESRVRLKNVFKGETLKRAKQVFKEFPDVLESPVVPRKHLKDDQFGTIIPDDMSPSGWQIAINARHLFDPEDITFMIAEEAEHIAQELRGMPFDYNPIYAERIHEIEAKKVAHEITGLPEKSYLSWIVQPEKDALTEEMP